MYCETSHSELVTLVMEINEEVKIVEEHVKMHMAQREETKKYFIIVQQDLNEKKPLGESTVTLTMDIR